MLGAIHSTKISRNFSPKLSGSVRSNRKSFQISGPPFEEVLFSRSDRSEFWLNGSRPLFLKQSWPKMLIVVDLWCWTCKLTFWSFEPTDFFSNGRHNIIDNYQSCQLWLNGYRLNDSLQGKTELLHLKLLASTFNWLEWLTNWVPTCRLCIPEAVRVIHWVTEWFNSDCSTAILGLSFRNQGVTPLKKYNSDNVK